MIFSEEDQDHINNQASSIDILKKKLNRIHDEVFKEDNGINYGELRKKTIVF